MLAGARGVGRRVRLRTRSKGRALSEEREIRINKLISLVYYIRKKVYLRDPARHGSMLPYGLTYACMPSVLRSGFLSLSHEGVF